MLPHSTWNALGKALAPIQWDWPGWLPCGFLTILASEPGAGKSLLCLRLAASYLHDTDADDPPLPFQEIEKHYRAAGIAFATLRRAKKQLAVTSIRPQGKKEWYWSLPGPGGDT